MRDRFLWIGCLVYAALFSWLGFIKFEVHRNLVDFGIFAQTVASAFGCFCNPLEGSHWAIHFSPILYPVALVVAVAHSPLTLVALQAIAGALVAPPVYAIVRSRADRTNARLAASVAWLYPPLAGVVFGDFHENGFAPAAVAWTLYAFDAGSLSGTLLGAAVTLSIKEDQGLFLAIAGGLGAWRFRGTPRGRVAAIVCAVSVTVVVLFFGVIRPHAASLPGWQPWRFYAWDGTSTSAVLSGLAARIGFLLLIFVPLAFLPFRSPMMWLTVAPLGEVLLSRMPTTFTLGTHYAGAWLGYVLGAFAFAVRATGLRARIVLYVCITFCVLELAVADPLHPGLNLRAVQPRDVVLDHFLRDIPTDASIATQEEAYTHLALTHPNATLLPEDAGVPVGTCYVLIDSDFVRSPRLQEYGAALDKLVRERRYVARSHSGGVTLYRRNDCQ